MLPAKVRRAEVLLLVDSVAAMLSNCLNLGHTLDALDSIDDRMTNWQDDKLAG